MGGSAPQPPDPYAVSGSQFGANLAAGESAQAATNVNQITPTGSLTYYQTGVGPNGVPTYTAAQQLSPAEQELLSLQQQTGAAAGGAAANTLGSDFANLSQAPNIGGPTSGATQALLGQETSYLQPYFQQQTQQLDNQLRNQGIMPGTPAYNQQMMQVQGNQNQAVTGFLAQAEPMAFQQSVAASQLPIQQAAALNALNTPQGPALTQTPGASYAPPDVTGAVNNANQANMAAYQAQMAQQAAMIQGLSGIASAGIKYSDGRLKRDRELVAVSKDGVPIYRYRFKSKDGWHMGPVAEDLVASIEIGGVLMIPGWGEAITMAIGG
jgi:hypothetical protein